MSLISLICLQNFFNYSNLLQTSFLGEETLWVVSCEKHMIFFIILLSARIDANYSHIDCQSKILNFFNL